MILIGISGKKGSGKDLLASYLNRKYGFVNIPFAESLKEMVRRDFNLTKEHTDGRLKEVFVNDTSVFTPRDIMIKYGQFFRQFDPLWWVKKTFQKINSLPCFIALSSAIRVTISDVRFKNEAEYIKSQGGILVRLERKPELNIYKTPSTDISETDLDNYDGFDFVLTEDKNVLPEDLEVLADEIMAYQSLFKPVE